MSNEPTSDLPPEQPASAPVPPPPPPAPPPAPGASATYAVPAGRVPPSIEGVLYQKWPNVLLTIVTCGIWSYIWVYRSTDDLKQYNGDGLGGLVQLLLAIFINPVVWFTIPNEIEKMYQRDGRQSPVSTLWGLWFLLPIIGNFIWYFKMQDSLNDFWRSKGAVG